MNLFEILVRLSRDYSLPFVVIGGHAVNALDTIAAAIDPAGELPLAVCGSVGTRLAGRLSAAVRGRLVEAAEGPAAGALRLIRNTVDQPEVTQ